MRKGIVASVASRFISPMAMKTSVMPEMTRRAFVGTLFGPRCNGRWVRDSRNLSLYFVDCSDYK